MQTPDVVVLVPGFLGFTHFGGFYYFADRLIAVLRGLYDRRPCSAWAWASCLSFSWLCC